MKLLKSKRITLVLLLVIFMLPGLCAYWLYEHPHWLSPVTTNKGRLLTPPVLLSQLPKTSRWGLLLWNPGRCSAVCQQQLNKITRIRLALGRRFYEVNLWLVTDNSKPIQATKIEHVLKKQGIAIRSLFLDATTDTLVRRYSETRRKHPLSQSNPSNPATDQRRALVEAIELERELLADLRETAHVIDTSIIRPSQLQGHVKALITARGEQLTLVFESFAFKRGVPGDADYVFDVRMLPNPHYEPELRHLTGQDAPVIAFLQEQPEATQMLEHIQLFLNHWLASLARDHRSYVTVAIGCTGGQHRSVYLVEQLVQRFSPQWVTLKRHRELEAA